MLNGLFFIKKSEMLEEELRQLHETELDKKENEIHLIKEKNLHFETYDKKVIIILCAIISFFVNN